MKPKTRSNRPAVLEISEFEKTEKPKNSWEEHMHVHEHPIIYHPSHSSDGFTMKYYLKIQSDFGLLFSFPRSLLLKSGPEGPETYPAPNLGPNISRTRFFPDMRFLPWVREGLDLSSCKKSIHISGLDFRRNSKNLDFHHFLALFSNFLENRIFFQKSGSVTFLRIKSYIFMQKIRKIWRRKIW